MANTDADRGFTPVKYMDGRPYTGAARRFFKDATAGILGVGDPVIRVTNSSATSNAGGYPECVRATTGSAISGVVVGIEPIRSALGQNHLAAADVGYLLVATSPDLLFEVQDNGGATALTIADIGEHIDSVTALDANTTTGRSKYEIDTEAQATDNTWRIEALVDRPDNATGANAKWLVSANLHTEVNASASTKTEV